MDFGFNKETDKKTGFETTAGAGSFVGSGEIGSGDFNLNKDHSPSKSMDFMKNEKLSEKKTSGSTDDFEHVDHDPFMSSSYPEPVKVANAIKTGAPLDDFMTSNTDLGNNFSQFITQTQDFLEGERQKSPEKQQKTPVLAPIPTPAAVSVPLVKQSGNSSTINTFVEHKPTAPAASELITDIEIEHFESPVKKNLKEESEKFISSEDLLGDFKDERTNTPEPILKPQPPKIEPPPPPTTTSSSTTKIPVKPIIPDIIHDEPIKPITPSSEPIKANKFEEKKPISITSKVEEIKKSDPKPTTTEKKIVQPTKQMISAEEMFCRFGLDAWFKPERLHPRVESLIYWRDVKKSGIVFGAGLVILLAISCFSVISVFAYASLLALAGTIAFRIYKNVLGAVQKTSEGHPFKEYLELDLNLSQDKVQQIVNVAVAHINGTITELRRLFLVEDLVDSIKFCVILWVFTYIGAWFNGMTLVILAFVALFTLPKVYENNKQSIDTYLDLVRSKFLEITDKVKAAVPIGKKPETEKDK